MVNFQSPLEIEIHDADIERLTVNFVDVFENLKLQQKLDLEDLDEKNTEPKSYESVRNLELNGSSRVYDRIGSMNFDFSSSEPRWATAV